MPTIPKPKDREPLLNWPRNGEPMERWNHKSDRVENPKIDAFLAEIEQVCKRHRMSIAHEDSHGGFIIEPFDAKNIEWLNEATDATESSS